MRLIAGLLLALAATSTSAAPARPAPATPAQRNLADFDFVTATIRDNYAGWETKVSAASRPELDRLTAELRVKAAGASDSQLRQLLRDWLGFFHDHHISLNWSGNLPAGVTHADYPSISLDEAAARARLAALGSGRDPIEGIWGLDGDLYRMAVLRTGASPDRFQAVVISTKSQAWKAGQIKAELVRRPDGRYDILFRSGDHGEDRQIASLVGGGVALDVPTWDGWVREWPDPADPHRLELLLPPKALSLERYDASTLLLRIPDFRDDKAKPLRELVAAHAAELAATPNLIIDERNNGGGSDYVYDPLVPLLYSRPTITVGMELRATRRNIALRHAIAEKLKADEPQHAAEFERENRIMAAHIGQYVLPDPRPFEIDRRSSVLPNPRHIAILIDGAGSTGEQFLLLARQSRKVTLLGQRNSAGVLDFANQVSMPTPSGRYQLAWRSRVRCACRKTRSTRTGSRRISAFRTRLPTPSTGPRSGLRDRRNRLGRFDFPLRDAYLRMHDSIHHRLR